MPETSTVEVNGFPCRVWRQGSGPKLGFLAGFGGLPRWIPFLDRLAAERTVIVPSLPGFPGATGHNRLDSPPTEIGRVVKAANCDPTAAVLEHRDKACVG